MHNFLIKNGAGCVSDMYGKEVYFTLFPDGKAEHFIYKGKLLGYGAYGPNPEYKTFCIHVDRGDGYFFVDYFQDGCFVAKEEFENFKTEKKKSDYFTVGRLAEIAKEEEDYIVVKVKVGDMTYQVCGIAEQARSEKVPAFVLKVNVDEGERWTTE